MQKRPLSLGLVVLGSALAMTSGTAAANERGERVFKRCQACHTVEEGASHSRGPNLHGMFGRKAGTNGEYIFSDALKSSGVTWTEKTLAQFLAEPRTYIPGNTMRAPAVRKAEDREALIVYLRDVTQ